MAVLKLSIIIPAYNAEKYIEETLRSVWAEELTDYEIIVVDDGSRDGTRAVLERYSDRINYIRQPNSGGCSAPRNKGISAARGRYIAFLDADDVVVNHRVKRQVDLLEKYPDIGFVFSDFQNWDGSSTWEPHTLTCPLFRAIRKASLGEDAYLVPKAEAYRTLFFENFILPSTVMFHRRILDVGLMDEALKSSEDVDFCFRVTKKYDIGYLDMVGVHRRLHQTNMSNNLEKVLLYKILAREKQLNVEKSHETQEQLVRTIVSLRNSLAHFYRKSGRRREALSYALSTLTRVRANPGSMKELSKTLVQALACLPCESGDGKDPGSIGGRLSL